MPDFQDFFKINDFKTHWKTKIFKNDSKHTQSDFLTNKQLKHIWKISDRGLVNLNFEVNSLDFGYPSF